MGNAPLSQTRLTVRADDIGAGPGMVCCNYGTGAGFCCSVCIPAEFCPDPGC